MKRRRFLQLAASTAAGAAVKRVFALPSSAKQLSLRIAPISVELAPHVVVRTTGYNSQSPGPVLRMREGVPVAVSITNATEVPERVQWSGLRLSHPYSGTPEEDNTMIAPGATSIYPFTPAVSGTHWYRPITTASTDPIRVANSGQFGFLLIEPRSDAGAFDQEVLLAIHHWEPSLSPTHKSTEGRRIMYRYASFNDKLLGAGEPIRVRAGERVLFRFLNASATEDVLLHLPGHRFTVVALDGNPVPEQTAVDVLSLTIGERIDAIVEMNSPGNWLLGSVDDAERARGLGICIEYANHNAPARWSPPAAVDWSYARFSAAGHSKPQPDQIFKLLLERKFESPNSIHHWIVNGRPLSEIDPLFLQQGHRYRLHMMNATGQAQPIHLNHYNFEITRVNQIPVSGIFKDAFRLERYNVVEADIFVNHRSPALIHLSQLLSLGAIA